MKSSEYYEHFREYLCNHVFHPSLSRLERSEMRRGFSNFTIKDGRLFYVGPKRRYMRLVVLTEGEKATVLQECHQNLKTGKHRGLRDTRNRVIAGYFWSTLIKDVTDWVVGCHCHNKTQKPVSYSIKVTEAWEVISLDLFGPLPVTARGHQYVMTMTDLYTKWVAAEPLKCKSAGEVSAAIVSQMYSFGMVRKILTNQNKGFVNEVNDRIFQILQLKDSVSCVYQRQTSKQDKRKNLDIKRALRKYFKETPDDWDLQLPAVVYAINTTPQVFTKHTSYFLMFHRHPQSPELMNDCPSEDGDPEEDVGLKTGTKVIYNIEMPRENEQGSHEKRKRKLEEPCSVIIEDHVPISENTIRVCQGPPPACTHQPPATGARPSSEKVTAVVENKGAQQELRISWTRSYYKQEDKRLSAAVSLQDHRYCLPEQRRKDHDHLYAYPHVKWERDPSPPQDKRSPGIMELSPPPPGLEAEYAVLFSTDSCHFLHELISTFDEEVDQILQLRAHRKAYLDLSGDLPNFLESTAHIRADPVWKVMPVPPRLQRRHVDIGDLAPCDTERFIRALQSPAQGIQVDFDDGNCPTFHNQIRGIHNIVRAVYKQIPDVPPISQAPVLMLRPRAWNMVEHNLLVNGKEAPGPLFDFGLIIFHCGKQLLEHQSGPFFYLSKVESYMEARLWNKIFVWTQQKLGLPLGSIKATVLIENVLAAFEMEEILYELRDHSAGLNCGIWDYSASFINKFGHRQSFLLPDRSKYVDMEKHFLRSYMDLLVQTCHRRAALATGGMAALLLPQDPHSDSYKRVLEAVRRHVLDKIGVHRENMQTLHRLKLLEIRAGVDGFMVYDLNLIQPMQKLFQLHTTGDNQLHQLRPDVSVTASDLLQMPPGGVTLYGVRYNIAVGVLFIKAWLSGKGHFSYRGQVEDSATAEISRSQLWQWIRHQTQLEDDCRVVSKQLVTDLTKELLMEMSSLCDAVRTDQMLHTAANMFLEVVVKRHFPEFITTYLNQDHTFIGYHSRPHVEVPDRVRQSRL